MTTLKRYIYSLLMLMTAATSCNTLDLSPSDIIDPSKAFRNVEDVNLGLLGAYAYLDYTLITSSAMVSDELVLPTENNVSNTEAHRWLYNSGSGSVTSAFNEFYVVIDRVNRVLAAIDQVETPTDQQALKERYHGELLALRAYSHFELLRAYASAYETGALGVPYMKISVISYPPRDPFEQVISNIKADLNTARELIPTTFNEKTRVTRNTVIAMQARLALYEKNWSDAIAYSSEVINAVPLAGRTAFADVWTDADDTEVLWKLKRTGSDSRIGSFFFRESGGIVLYAPSFKLLNSFDKDNDIRYTSYITYNPDRGEGRSAYLVKKYVGGNASAPGLADIKLFRAAEMYLIRAEAFAETSGRQTDAAADIHTLRRARINGYTNEAFAGKDELIGAVYDERFKELAFEGHRFFDLRRRNLPVERLPEDAVNAVGAVKLTPAQAQYTFPIPSREMSVNRNMVQNPGY